MRKKEEISETGSKFADGLLMPIIAVGAVFLFIVLSFYAYDSVMKNKTNNQIVVLDGDESSFKVEPKDPGGMQVQHKDKEVFNTVSGTQETIDEESLNIQQQEQPISKEEISGSEENKNIQLPSQVGEKSVFVIKPKEAPKFNESLVVNKDSQIIEMAENQTQNAIEEVKKQAEKQAENIIEESSDKLEEDVNIISDEVVGLNPQNNIKDKEIDKIVEVKKSENNEVKAEVTKVKDNTTGENKTVVMFKDKPKSMGGAESKQAAPKADSQKDSYYVQVSSHTSAAEAKVAWGKISSKYKAETSGFKNNITEAEVGGKTFYRLSFGPFADRASASTSCGILKAKGQDCIIQKY
jgi:cell division septation protein DedD